jgi:hypothetical protein
MHENCREFSRYARTEGVIVVFGTGVPATGRRYLVGKAETEGLDPKEITPTVGLNDESHFVRILGRLVVRPPGPLE